MRHCNLCAVTQQKPFLFTIENQRTTPFCPSTPIEIGQNTHQKPLPRKHRFDRF